MSFEIMEMIICNGTGEILSKIAVSEGVDFKESTPFYVVRPVFYQVGVFIRNYIFLQQTF